MSSDPGVRLAELRRESCWRQRRCRPRTHHDSGSFSLLPQPLAVLATALDQLGRYEPAATILNKPFLDSIAEHGVLIPITAIRRRRWRGGSAQRAAPHHGGPHARVELGARVRAASHCSRHGRCDRPDRAPDRHQRPQERPDRRSARAWHPADDRCRPIRSKVAKILRTKASRSSQMNSPGVVRTREEITRAFDRSVVTGPTARRSGCSSIRRASRGG